MSEHPISASLENGKKKSFSLNVRHYSDAEEGCHFPYFSLSIGANDSRKNHDGSISDTRTRRSTQRRAPTKGPGHTAFPLQKEGTSSKITVASTTEPYCSYVRKLGVSFRFIAVRKKREERCPMVAGTILPLVEEVEQRLTLTRDSM